MSKDPELSCLIIPLEIGRNYFEIGEQLSYFQSWNRKLAFSLFIRNSQTKNSFRVRLKCGRCVRELKSSSIHGTALIQQIKQNIRHITLSATEYEFWLKEVTDPLYLLNISFISARRHLPCNMQLKNRFSQKLILLTIN